MARLNIRVLRLAMVLLAFLCFSRIAYAQAFVGQAQSISGKPIPFATVTVCSGWSDALVQNPQQVCNAPAPLSPPSQPVLTAVTDSNPSAGTYEVEITYVNPAGETVASAFASITTSGGTLGIQVTSPAAYSNATGWNAYFTTAGESTTFYKQNSVAIAIGTNYTQSAAINTGGASPPSVTTATNAVLPLASPIYSNAEQTNVLSNPFNADANGRYTFFAPIGEYTGSVAAPGYTTYSSILPIAASSNGFANLAPGINSNSGTFGGSGNSWNFSAALSFIVPSVSSLTTAGQFAQEGAGNAPHFYYLGTDIPLAGFFGSIIAGNCPTVTYESGNPVLTTGGLQCVTQTGSVTPGHLAVFEGSAVIEDGGAIPSAASAIQSVNTSTLSSNISLSASTLTTVVTQAVTMPSSGCPCRVTASYSILYLTGSNNSSADAAVSDGTNTFATSQQHWPATANSGGQTMSETSPVDYTNSQNVTFTLSIETNQSGNSVEAAPLLFGQNTHLTITVLTSVN